MKSDLQKLNLIQFFAALNENLFKMIVAFFVIFLTGKELASQVMIETGGLFLIPFLLFSTLGGLLADKFSKKTIIIVTRIIELSILVLAFFSFALYSILGSYILLFLLASTSAIFGPSKYGLIPEVYPRTKIVKANSLIAAFTFFGIILGTGLASFFVEITDDHFFLALAASAIFASLSLFISFFLPATPPVYAESKIPMFVYKEIIFSLMEMKRIEKLLPVSLAYAYFLFLGAFLQLNIIPFSIITLNLSVLSGGYLFLLSSIGIALGSFITSKLSKEKINLLFIPGSGLGISVTLFLLAFFPTHIYLICVYLIILGFFGGIFLVVSQSYILFTSPDKTRGRNISTANFFSFFFAALAPLVLYILNIFLNISPRHSFFIVGITNTLIMILFYYLFKNPKKILPR